MQQDDAAGTLSHGGLAPVPKLSGSGLPKADCGDCEVEPQMSKSLHNRSPHSRRIAALAFMALGVAESNSFTHVRIAVAQHIPGVVLAAAIQPPARNSLSRWFRMLIRVRLWDG
jgi:hypothetical protein